MAGEKGGRLVKGRRSGAAGNRREGWRGGEGRAGHEEAVKSKNEKEEKERRRHRRWQSS